MSNEAPEHVRLVKREGVLDGHWYYPDAAIMPYETEIRYRRVDPPAAPACIKCKHSDLLRAHRVANVQSAEKISASMKEIHVVSV